MEVHVHMNMSLGRTEVDVGSHCPLLFCCFVTKVGLLSETLNSLVWLVSAASLLCGSLPLPSEDGQASGLLFHPASTRVLGSYVFLMLVRQVL